MNAGPKTADWLSQEFLADPYPHYAAMRESDPVHFDESRGSWLLFRYADVEPALRDNERFSAEQQPGGSMLVTDPPDHTRLRTLVSKAFTARTVSGLAPRIQGLVDDLLDAAAARGEMDAIADFAYPLPITVIAEMLGVEPDRRDFFRTASQKIAVAMGPITDAETAFRAIEGRNELIAYFEELIPKRKADPRDDVSERARPGGGPRGRPHSRRTARDAPPATRGRARDDRQSHRERLAGPDAQPRPARAAED